MDIRTVADIERVDGLATAFVESQDVRTLLDSFAETGERAGDEKMILVIESLVRCAFKDGFVNGCKFTSRRLTSALRGIAE